MVDVRRLVAGLASVVLMVGVFASPSGAVAAPLSTDPPVVSAEASEDELTVAATADEDATSQDQEKPSVEAKDPAPDPKRDEPKPSADPKADDDASADDDAVADDSSPKPKPSADTPPATSSTDEDEAASTPELPDEGSVSPDPEDASEGAVADAEVTTPDGGDADASDEAAVPPVRRAVITPMAGSLSQLSAAIAEDGNKTSTVGAPISFDSDGRVMAADGVTVLDEDEHNQIVAANDSVIYEITAVSASGPQTLVAVLPEGMECRMTGVARNWASCRTVIAR